MALKVNYDGEGPIPRPLPKWEGVSGSKGQHAAGGTVRERGGVVRVNGVRAG